MLGFILLLGTVGFVCFLGQVAAGTPRVLRGAAARRGAAPRLRRICAHRAHCAGRARQRSA
jgi:hypothetical protein